MDVVLSNLTLYAPCVILQCVDKPTRCTNSYKCSLFLFVLLYVFRTITSPSSGAPSSKLYQAFGTFVQDDFNCSHFEMKYPFLTLAIYLRWVQFCQYVSSLRPSEL